MHKYNKIYQPNRQDNTTTAICVSLSHDSDKYIYTHQNTDTTTSDPEVKFHFRKIKVKFLLNGILLRDLYQTMERLHIVADMSVNYQQTKYK